MKENTIPKWLSDEFIDEEFYHSFINKSYYVLVSNFCRNDALVHAMRRAYEHISSNDEMIEFVKYLIDIYRNRNTYYIQKKIIETFDKVLFFKINSEKVKIEDILKEYETNLNEGIDPRSIRKDIIYPSIVKFKMQNIK